MRLAMTLLWAGLAWGGVIQGVVLEHSTNRALARAVVRLDPLPGASGGRPETVRSGRSGQFVLTGVPPGRYLLTALRDGYFPAAYGQRLPAGRGLPVEVTADSTLFTELRMRRKGVITGRVLDENGVATTGVPVSAYRARLPLRQAGTGVSDDRGVYRIHGLMPGKYWVRSGGHRLEDGTGWLPTFCPVSREARDAKVHAVTVDSETQYADVSPEAGFVYRLSGTVTCPAPGAVTVVVSSETLQMRTQTACGTEPGGYAFDGLPSGYYEVFAQMGDKGPAAAQEFLLQRDTGGLNLSLAETPRVEIRAEGPEVPVKLWTRRRELSESEPWREFAGRVTTLAPGTWEFRATVPVAYYVSAIAASGFRRRRTGAAADHFEIYIEPRYQQVVQVKVSDGAGAMEGQVRRESNQVVGAPVFLWPVAESARRSLGGSRETLTDADGKFRFEGLPPGEYRVLASFDVIEFDAETAEASQAPSLKVEAARTTVAELTPWSAPY